MSPFFVGVVRGLGFPTARVDARYDTGGMGGHIRAKMSRRGGRGRVMNGKGWVNSRRLRCLIRQGVGHRYLMPTCCRTRNSSRRLRMMWVCQDPAAKWTRVNEEWWIPEARIIPRSLLLTELITEQLPATFRSGHHLRSTRRPFAKHSPFPCRLEKNPGQYPILHAR